MSRYAPKTFWTLTFHDKREDLKRDRRLLKRSFSAWRWLTLSLFAPSVSVPMLAVSGIPVGIQLVGQQHQDAHMPAFAQWLHTTSRL